MLTLPLDTARLIASAALVVAPKRDGANGPLLESARVYGGALYATDRRRCLRARLKGASEASDPGADDVDLTIPRDALAWVAAVKDSTLRLVKKREAEGGAYSARWEQDDQRVTASLIDPDGEVERSQAFDAIGGNYPPVGKLFDNWEPLLGAEARADGVEFGVPPALFADVMAWIGKQSNAVRVQLGADLDGSVLPGPVLITGAGVEFLIQPAVHARPLEAREFEVR